MAWLAKPPIEPSSMVIRTSCSVARRRTNSSSMGLANRASATVADSPRLARGHPRPKGNRPGVFHKIVTQSLCPRVQSYLSRFPNILASLAYLRRCHYRVGSVMLRVDRQLKLGFFTMWTKSASSEAAISTIFGTHPR